MALVTVAVMRHSICCALVMTLVSVPEAFAQTPSGTPDDFSGLSVGRTITVVPDKGWPIRGRVRSVTPDRLTLGVKGRDIVFDRSNVVSAFERKTAAKKGMIIGLAVGGGIAIAGLASSRSGDDYAQAAAGMFVILGLGIGAGVGAMIPTKRLLYEKPKGATSGAGLQMRVSW